MRTKIYSFWITLWLVGATGIVSATTYTITNTRDFGDGSLRWAIFQTNGNAGTDTIEFNIPGSGPHSIMPASALPLIYDPVVIDGYTQDGAFPNTNPVDQGLNTVLMIIVDGSNADESAGIEISCGGCTVRGLVINNFETVGIFLHTSGGNVIEGNFIGTNVSGTNTSGDSYRVVIWSNGNTVGGTTPAARNLISGSMYAGVYIDEIDGGGASNVIQGNLIGTDISGTVSLGNDISGIMISGGSNNTIGGTEPGARNVISGSGITDVIITDETAMNNVVCGNFIGTDVFGTFSLSDAVAGVTIQQQASDNTIGGSTEGAGNVVSGHNEYGISLINEGTTGNLIQGNFIGTDYTGTQDLGNDEYGVEIKVGASGNSIGGMTEGSGNIIAFNDDGGVAIDFGSDNAIVSNSIFSNGGPGIDLGRDSVTPNDVGDGDSGANNLQNYPVLTSATSVHVQGTINSTPNTELNIQFFSNTECDPTGHGEGENYLGNMVVLTDGTGDAYIQFPFPYAIPEGQIITATATDPSENTSEFSQCIEVRDVCILDVTYPNGGETWETGEMETITWTSDNTSGIVVIEYSVDGGNIWAVISGGTDDDGFYEWTVPGVYSDACLVLVCDTGDSTCCGISDDVFTIHANCDFAVAHIAVSNPVSVGYTTPIRVAVTNLSPLDMVLGDALIDILDEWGESIFYEGPVKMDYRYEGLFYISPAGDTLPYTYTYDWIPSETGNFSIKVSLDFPCDTFSVNDMMDAGPVTVSASGTGLLGYFDQYSSERDTIYLEIEGGPAVRLTIPDDFPGASIHTLYFGAVLDNPEASLWVYLFEAGPDDTTFGQELIEPFEFFPQEVDSTGLIAIDLTARPDYENLTGLSGDFWVHLKATQPEALGFTARPALPESGIARNWYYVWSTPRSGNNGQGIVCQPPGNMDPFSRGWEELVGLDYSTCLIERGDVTRDGKVNVLDVLAVINHILGIIVIEDLETLCRADCNNDTAVNVLDALGIANVILGIGECVH